MAVCAEGKKAETNKQWISKPYKYVCDFARLIMTRSKESLQPFQLANITANTSKQAQPTCSAIFQNNCWISKVSTTNQHYKLLLILTAD